MGGGGWISSRSGWLLELLTELTIQLNLEQRNMTKGLFRKELGDDLEIGLLEMTVEGQEERIRARHDGNQETVEMLRASIVCFKNDLFQRF